MIADFVYDAELPHPPALLWQLLSTPNYLALWLMENNLKEVAVGARFTFSAGRVPTREGLKRWLAQG